MLKPIVNFTYPFVQHNWGANESINLNVKYMEINLIKLPSYKPKFKSLSLRVSMEQKRIIEEYCEQNKMKKSDFIRYLLEIYLNGIATKK